MNKLVYDSMTAGNHELEDGSEVLWGFIDNLGFSIFMLNADVGREKLLADKLPKFTVIERGGELIGLIGLMPKDTYELISMGDNITFLHPIGTVQNDVDHLSAQVVNKIIALSHLSFVMGRRVAAKATGVDVMVGGHSHMYLSSLFDSAKGPYPMIVGITAIV